MTCSRDIRFKLEFQVTDTVLITARDLNDGHLGEKDYIESEVNIDQALTAMLEMRKIIEGWT